MSTAVNGSASTSEPRRAAAAPPAGGGGMSVPLQLPPRYDGRRITTLSASSYELWQSCEEKWRRRNLLGEREPKSPAMFLGIAVDQALGWLHEHQIAGADPEAGDVLKAYGELFEANERDRRDTAWTDDEPESMIRAAGLRCVEIYLERMLPLIGQPVATQREIEVRLHPACEWSIKGFIDLETVRDRPVDVTDKGLVIPAGEKAPRGQRVVARRPEREPAINDYKVKTRFISAGEAAGNVQCGIYVLDRRLRGEPPVPFVFANLVRPGSNRNGFDGRLQLTERNDAQLRSVMVRFAQMANAIVERVELFGYERPWKFADPRQSFPCRRRFCGWADSCPGWSGL
jgi:hypothetical protein